ncbi:MAG TPA: 3-oxoacyl-ACP reductase [Gammaproteobacteria bacterium]|nr:3-oxoacyl-ACP reductase [Gammaproteobacteria bacterium]|tara:strand:+ start:96 stop:830 length:735 start_codon:yes stop_codon:yes gene_type:complete
MSALLDGQLALVTGAGRGIGRACAEGLAAAGAKVIAVARSEEDLAEVSTHPSGRIDCWTADVTDDEFIEQIATIDGLSILVNNAGGNRPQPFIDVDIESLDFIIDLNIRAAFRVAQAAAKTMLLQDIGGSIVNMSSQMGHVGSPNRTVYCMTKHAIEGLTKAMAVELAPKGIRVNTVAPTFVETPLTKPMLEDPEFREFVYGMIPLGKLASLDDVVAAVLYLVSPGAGMVTGHSLRVDGGWTAH